MAKNLISITGPAKLGRRTLGAFLGDLLINEKNRQYFVVTSVEELLQKYSNYHGELPRKIRECLRSNQEPPRDLLVELIGHWFSITSADQPQVETFILSGLPIEVHQPESFKDFDGVVVLVLTESSQPEYVFDQIPTLHVNRLQPMFWRLDQVLDKITDFKHGDRPLLHPKCLLKARSRLNTVGNPVRNRIMALDTQVTNMINTGRGMPSSALCG